MVDRLLAFAALLLFAGFCFVLVWYINRADLAIVCGIVVLMAAYDFFLEAGLRPKIRVIRTDPGEQKDQI